jgi:hypothetical protein
MGLFGPSKGSIGEVINKKVKAGQPYGTGSATKVQQRQAKARQKEIEEELARKKQEKKDIRKAKLLRGPPNAGKAAKFNANAIARGDKGRAKKAAKKAVKKEERKARGFWSW